MIHVGKEGGVYGYVAGSVDWLAAATPKIVERRTDVTNMIFTTGAEAPKKRHH
jgi:hypothetical protein